MSYANLAQSIGPSGLAIQRAPESQCGMAPHRGDVITVRATSYVRLQETKRIEKLQAHVPLEPDGWYRTRAGADLEDRTGVDREAYRPG